jgi:hypothetical protein
MAAQVSLCLSCRGQSGNAVGFLRAHQFPLPILIPLNALFLASSTADTMGHLWLDYQRTHVSLTPPAIKKA